MTEAATVALPRATWRHILAAAEKVASHCRGERGLRGSSVHAQADALYFWAKGALTAAGDTPSARVTAGELRMLEWLDYFHGDSRTAALAAISAALAVQGEA